MAASMGAREMDLPMLAKAPLQDLQWIIV